MMVHEALGNGIWLSVFFRKTHARSSSSFLWLLLLDCQASQNGLGRSMLSILSFLVDIFTLLRWIDLPGYANNDGRMMDE